MRENDVTEDKLAKAISVSQGTVSKYLNGKRQPRPGKAKKICKFTNYEITLDDLYYQKSSEASFSVQAC